MRGRPHARRDGRVRALAHLEREFAAQLAYEDTPGRPTSRARPRAPAAAARDGLAGGGGGARASPRAPAARARARRRARPGARKPAAAAGGAAAHGARKTTEPGAATARAADGGAGRTVDFQRHIHRDELKRASDKNQARRAIPPLLGSEKTGPLYGAALPQQPHTART